MSILKKNEIRKDEQSTDVGADFSTLQVEASGLRVECSTQSTINR